MLRPPSLRCKPDETFAEAHRRWRARFDEYSDARVMWLCSHYASILSVKQVMLYRAFYGVPAFLVSEVYE